MMMGVGLQSWHCVRGKERNVIWISWKRKQQNEWTIGQQRKRRSREMRAGAASELGNGDDGD